MTDKIDNEPWFEIERRLRDDTDGSERDALLRRIDDATRVVKKRMDAGLTPTEFAELQTVYHGFESAHKIIDIVWRSSQRS